jgi:hypothetical protein
VTVGSPLVSIRRSKELVPGLKNSAGILPPARQNDTTIQRRVPKQRRTPEKEEESRKTDMKKNKGLCHIFCIGTFSRKPIP